MDGLTRRRLITVTLETSDIAVKGAVLAEKFGVSRQVIVQDIALLRAKGKDIISTAEGYLSYSATDDTLKRVYCVNHNDDELEEELLVFVDNGGHVLNIIVDHTVYGGITVDLHLSNRKQVGDFMSMVTEGEFIPLMSLTKGNHYHTIEAENEQILNNIEKDLRIKGFLVE